MSVGRRRQETTVGFFKRRQAPAPARVPEHAVLVHVALSGGDFGTAEDREAIFALEDEMHRAVQSHAVGEIDGHEFGNGEAVIFAYGPDADALFAAIEPALRAASLRAAHAIIRYGEPDDPQVVQRSVDV